MQTLVIDLETSPLLAWTWSLKDLHVGLNQIVQSSRVICASWAWDDGPVEFGAEWLVTDRAAFIEELWGVLNRADVVVHFNGRRFDVPHCQREFIQLGLTPPSPYAQVDLYTVVKGQFSFPSNRLEYVLKALGRAEKIKTDFALWARVLDGDEKAQAEMRKYNMQDVRSTKELYRLVLPWIRNHPNTALYVDADMACVSCGSSDLVREGFAYTRSGRFQQYHCRRCGRWMRGAKRDSTTDLREVL
jgi:DNA polymerase elongation subunit (family B)